MTAARASQALRHAWPGTRHLSSPRYFCPVDGARPQPGPCACVRVCGRLWGAVRCRVRVFSGTLVSEEGRSCLCVEVLGRELPQPQTKGCSELPEVCVCGGGSEGARTAACGVLHPDAPHPVSIHSLPRGLWVAGARVFLRRLCPVGRCAGRQGRAHPRYSRESQWGGGPWRSRCVRSPSPPGSLP